MATKLGLPGQIDEGLQLLKVHLPYHESDHVLNLAYNVLCAGTRLEDIERLRHDTAHMNALGADLIPHPTTAGVFCRRFTEADVVVPLGGDESGDDEDGEGTLTDIDTKASVS